MTTSAKISATLSVQAHPGEIDARMMFTNESPHTEFLDVVNAGLHPRFSANVFVVTCDGAAVSFKSPKRKISLPDKEKYRALESGESLQVNVRLDRSYDFTLPGVYSIQYRGVHGAGAVDGVFVVTSNSVALRV